MKGTLDLRYINQLAHVEVVVGLNFIPFVFLTILLLYQFDILLLKQKKLPVLDMTHFILRISAFTRLLRLKRNHAIYNTGRFMFLKIAVSFTYSYSQPVKYINSISDGYYTTID